MFASPDFSALLHFAYFSLYTLVPYQENVCDGGVFVCRYAYNLYMMRHLKFTWVDFIERFKSMITRGPAFQFDMEDIARIREEIGTLINKLSEIYLAMKAEEKKEKKKSKRQAMKSSEKEKQDASDAKMLPSKEKENAQNSLDAVAAPAKLADSSGNDSEVEEGHVLSPIV